MRLNLNIAYKHKCLFTKYVCLLQALGLRFPIEGEDIAQLKKINGLFNHSFGPGNSRILDRFPVLNFLREEFKVLKEAMRLRNLFWTEHEIHNLKVRCVFIFSVQSFYKITRPYLYFCRRH